MIGGAGGGSLTTAAYFHARVPLALSVSPARPVGPAPPTSHSTAPTSAPTSSTKLPTVIFLTSTAEGGP